METLSGKLPGRSLLEGRILDLTAEMRETLNQNELMLRLSDGRELTIQLERDGHIVPRGELLGPAA